MLDNFSMHDNCGVFAIFGSPRAAELTYFALYSLQHRGQESAGIVTGGNGSVHIYKNMGEVNEVFADRDILNRLKGSIAIGHTRYSTTLVFITPKIVNERLTVR